MEFPSDRNPPLTILPKVNQIPPSFPWAELMTQTAAAPFWEQCCLLWTLLVANPGLPDRDSHSQVLSNLQNLYRGIRIVLSPEVTPISPLDHSVVESLRIFVVEYLAHIGRALG